MKNPDAVAVPIIQHPDVRRDLLWMKAHVEGIRAMNYFVAYCVDMSRIAATEEESKKWMGFVELMTPVVKAFCSDKAVEICSLAIDLYGGYGYISEYPVEQYMRDAKIACLYEGTNGVQALDLVGRKLAQNKGQNVMNLLFEMAATIDKVKKNPELKPYGAHLEDAHMAVMLLGQQFGEWAKGGNFLVPLINARPFLMIMGDLIIGWMLLQAAGIAADKLGAIYRSAGAEGAKGMQRGVIRNNAEAAFYFGKVAVAKYFAVNVLTQIKGRCKSIQLADKTPIEIPDEAFGM